MHWEKLHFIDSKSVWKVHVEKSEDNVEDLMDTKGIYKELEDEFSIKTYSAGDSTKSPKMGNESSLIDSNEKIAGSSQCLDEKRAQNISKLHS